MKKTYGTHTDLNLKLTIALSRSFNNLRRQEGDVIREAGLTLSQFGVLEALYHLGDLKVNQIIEKTLSTGGNMTVVIKNLEKDGLVVRRCDPEDKRAFIVSLTDQGHKVIDATFKAHLEVIDGIYQHLNLDEKGQLLHLLKRFNKRL